MNRDDQRTCFSVSEPNSARLLSFQSYFLALTRPAILQSSRREWQKEGYYQQWRTALNRSPADWECTYLYTDKGAELFYIINPMCNMADKKTFVEVTPASSADIDAIVVRIAIEDEQKLPHLAKELQFNSSQQKESIEGTISHDYHTMSRDVSSIQRLIKVFYKPV